MSSLGSANLDVAERILRLQAEWDELATHPDSITLTEAQRSELECRLAGHAASPDDVVSWADVKRAALARQ